MPLMSGNSVKKLGNLYLPTMTLSSSFRSASLRNSPGSRRLLRNRELQQAGYRARHRGLVLRQIGDPCSQRRVGATGCRYNHRTRT